MGGRCELHNEFGFLRTAPLCTDRNQILPFRWEGREWQSVEQGFQAFRFTSAAKQERICAMTRNQDESVEAYALRVQQAALSEVRADWDAVRVEVLYRAFRAMYASNPAAREDLLSTVPLIIHHSDGGFWGKWNGVIQMRLREELKDPADCDTSALGDCVEQFRAYMLREAGRIIEELPEKVDLPTLEVAPKPPPTVSLEVTVPDIDQSKVIEAFNKFDANGDGIIDLDDLVAVLQLVDSAWDETRVAKLMKLIDTDGDGLIGYEEFVAWVFADKGLDVLKSSFCGTFGVSATDKKKIWRDVQRWMVHDRKSTDYTRTSLRVRPSPKKDYTNVSVLNGEVVEIIGKEGEFLRVRVGLEGLDGWLHQRYLHSCPEGTNHDRSITSKDVRRELLLDTEPRLKVVRKFLRKRNRTCPGSEIRAEKVWFLPGHFLGEHGMEDGPKESLFLGCRDALAEAIAESGFDPVFEQVSGGDFGKGVHLSKQSCRAFTTAENYLLICEVAIGTEEERVSMTGPNTALDYKEVCEVRGKLSVKTELGPRYDHDTFAIYRPSQCKPIYLLKLETPGRYAFGGRL